MFNFASIACIADTSRHYLPVDVIKQVIDSMSFAKLVILPSLGLCQLCLQNYPCTETWSFVQQNVLHWHIIDEQSFPLEVPSYPNLWKGSYSKWERYTVEDAQDIVRYVTHPLSFGFSILFILYILSCIFFFYSSFVD